MCSPDASFAHLWPLMGLISIHHVWGQHRTCTKTPIHQNPKTQNPKTPTSLQMWQHKESNRLHKESLMDQKQLSFVSWLSPAGSTATWSKISSSESIYLASVASSSCKYQQPSWMGLIRHTTMSEDNTGLDKASMTPIHQNPKTQNPKL